MICMKCGREIADNQAFCEGCLQVMDTYPVKSDTPIQLPNRQPTPAAKKPTHRKRVLSPEEQLVQSKTTTRRLFWLCLVFALLWAISIAMLLYKPLQPFFVSTAAYETVAEYNG